MHWRVVTANFVGLHDEDEAAMRAVAETQVAVFNDETEAGVKALAKQMVLGYRNTEGTLTYQSRIYESGILFTLALNATVAIPSPRNLQITDEETILVTGPEGTSTTGLDADILGYITYPGFPILPVATYTGDGFGDAGSDGKRITIDSGGLFLAADSVFWVSDGHGPYIYILPSTRRMQQAIMPPAAYILHRNGSISFSANSPPIYDQNEGIFPANTVTGRNNNQGLEGLTVSSEGRTLYALMQPTLDQEGGSNNPARLQARVLEYDITCGFAQYKAKNVVTLPLYTNPTAKVAV